jgi:hypothetical protein
MAIIEMWTFREQFTADEIDLVGYTIEATDGKVGKVDEATYEVGGSYLVVETGPWIFGKKVMLPAGIVDRIDQDNETVFVNRTKDEIKNAPEFDETLVRDSSYRDELSAHYGGATPVGRRDELS